MKTTFIIRLIQQDMKHSQLVHGLQNLGLETHLHVLDVQDMVAQLMGFAGGRATNKWCSIYISFLRQASHYKITERGQNLLPLARECHACLLQHMDDEKLPRTKKR